MRSWRGWWPGTRARRSWPSWLQHPRCVPTSRPIGRSTTRRSRRSHHATTIRRGGDEDPSEYPMEAQEHGRARTRGADRQHVRQEGYSVRRGLLQAPSDARPGGQVPPGVRGRMNAQEYNAREMDAGRLTRDMVAWLLQRMRRPDLVEATRLFQQSEGLDVDGWAGPDTQA